MIHVSAEVYEYISECADYTTALQILESTYIVPKNIIYARHLLVTRQQKHGENLDEFLNALKLLAKDCNCQPVSAEENKQALIRDALINGLSSANIRQRLLENTTLTLDRAFTQAHTLDQAQKSSNAHTIPLPFL